MKKVIFILLSLSLFNTVFAQNSNSLDGYVGGGKFKITKSGVTLEHSKRIVCTESMNVFYIGFLNDTIILENDTIILDEKTIECNDATILKDTKLDDTTKLKELIVLKPEHKLTRKDIAQLIEPLDTTTKIFVQNCSSDGAFCDAQYIAKKSGKGVDDSYYVIIKRDNLPLDLVLNKKDKKDTIHVEAFNQCDEKQCELVRKKNTAYKELPECDTIAISKDSLKEYALPVLNLKGSNNAWKLEYNYYVDGTECKLDTIEGGTVNVMLPDEVCSKSEAEDTLTISYTVKCFHDDKYLNHIRKGELVKIIVKPSDGLSWLALISIFIGVVLAAIVVLFIIKTVRDFVKKYKKLNKHHKRNSKKGKDKSKEEASDKSKDESGDAHEQPDAESLKANDKTDANNENVVADNALNGFNEFVPDLEKLDTDEKKTEAIKNVLAAGKRAEECLSELRKELELLDNGIDKEQLINKVKELKKTLAQKEDALNSSPEKCYANVISWMQGKNNKTFDKLIEKANNECSNVRKDPYKKDVLEKLINLLALSLKDESYSASNASNDITEYQMNMTENRKRMLNWLITQLENKGYKGLRMGTTVDTTLKSLADTLIKTADVKEPSEIIDDAINNDKLSNEHKEILIGRLIKSLNSHITDGSALIEPSLSLDKFITMVSEKLQTPASFEDAQEAVRRTNINIVNKILESEISDFDDQSLQNALNSAIVKYLNKTLNGFTADDLDAANKELTDALKNSGILVDTLHKHKVDSIEKFPDEIRVKYSKDIINSVNERVAKLFPGESFEKVSSLVNSLLKCSESAKNNEELIIDALEEQISLRNKDFISQNCKDVIKLFEEYNSIVKSKEDHLESNIDKQEKEIKELESNISSKAKELQMLTEKNNTLMDESSKMVEVLHTAGETIKDACKTILNPCSDYDESLCLDIEDRLFGELSNMADRFNTFNLSIDCIPVDARHSIQQILIDEILAENSPVNTVCRYYAYSRLPFMTDTSREYGITFKRKNMSELYKAVETLYGRFGITLNIPDLFVAGFEEGNFENVTGQTYGDLDNLCQNSRNHFDNIDSNVKPSNIIVDVVNIGYAVDGKVERLASVLTY